MPRHQLIEVWVIGTKEKEVLLVGLGLSCSMVSNGTILLQVGGDLIRFALHLPPQMPPQTKNGLRPKP